MCSKYINQGPFLFKNICAIIFFACLSNLLFCMDGIKPQSCQAIHNPLQVLLNLAPDLDVRQEIVDALRLEENFMRSKIVSEIYDYFFDKFEKKAQLEPIFLEQVATEFKEFKEIPNGERIRAVLKRKEDFPALDSFFMFLFRASDCYVDANRMFPRDVSSPSRFLKIFNQVIDQEGFLKYEDVILFDSENRETILAKTFNFVAERNKKNGFFKSIIKGIEQAVLPGRSKKNSLRLQDADVEQKSLCSPCNISKKNQQAQEDFLLIKDSLFTEEGQKRNAVMASQQDKFKNRVAGIYENLYKFRIQDELRKSEQERKEVLQNASLEKHIVLQKELILELDNLRNETKKFATAVLEPNARELEKVRLKKEQRLFGSHVLKNNQTIKDTPWQGSETLQEQGLAAGKELVKKDRMQRRVDHKELAILATQMFKESLKNKNSRYAVGRRDVGCQTESDEKCLCSKKPLQEFSYERWQHIAVEKKCTCLACCGLRTLLQNSHNGCATAQEIERKFRLSSQYALSSYGYFESMARTHVSFPDNL